MRSIHLIDRERPVSGSVATPSLLSHSVCHEECLIGLLRPKHSVDPLGWGLRLGSSEILLLVLMNQSVRQRTVGHRVLVHSILLKV